MSLCHTRHSTLQMERDIEALQRADRRAWRMEEEWTHRVVKDARRDWQRELVQRRALEHLEEQLERLEHPSTGDPRALQRTLNAMESERSLTQRIEKRLRREADEIRPWTAGATTPSARPATAPARQPRRHEPAGRKPTLRAGQLGRRPRGQFDPTELMVCGISAGPPSSFPTRSGVATRPRAANVAMPRMAWG